MSALATRNDSQQVAERGRWRVVALCALAMAFAFMDRQILPLFIEPVKVDLHVTDVQFSLLTGLAFSIFYALCSIPVGRLIDSRSRPTILGVGIAVWSVATLLTGFGRSFVHVFLARMAVGVGESTVSPASHSMVTDLFLRDRLARALSTVSMGVGIGAGAALLLGGGIAKLIGSTQSIHLPLLGDLHAWQFVFLVLGAPGLILAPFMLFTVRDPQRRRVALRPDGAKAATSYLAMVRFAWAHRSTVAYNALGFGVFTLATGSLSAWAPAHFLRTFHLPVATVGLSMGVLQMIGTTTGLLVGGWWIDRKLDASRSDGAMQFSRNTAALALAPMLAFPFMPSFVLGLMMVVVCGSLCGAGYATVAISHQQLIPNQMRAQFSATYLVFSNLIGGTIGPTLVAALNGAIFHDPRKIGFSAAAVGGGALIVTIILLSLGLRHYRRSMEIVVNTTGD